MNHKKQSPVPASKLGLKILKQSYSTSSLAQRQRLLDWLKEKPITTIEARKYLDILGVAPRIFELRNYHNHNIQTVWAEETTDQGIQHRVARYVLHSGKYKEAK